MYTTKTYIYNDDDGSTPCCIIIYLKKPLIVYTINEYLGENYNKHNN